MTVHERVGPPTARPLGYEQPERGAAQVYKEYRIAILRAELTDLEIDDPAEAERVGSELSSRAGDLERELCEASISSEEDVLAAFNMLQEFQRERELHSYTDGRDGELLANVRSYVVGLLRQRGMSGA